jgi:hypothetical protein
MKHKFHVSPVMPRSWSSTGVHPKRDVQLLDLDDAERNETFAFLLRDNGRKCDRVIRTLFNGTVLGVDKGEAVCSALAALPIGENKLFVILTHWRFTLCANRIASVERWKPKLALARSLPSGRLV